MKLYSPQFERSLRRGVRKAIRHSPELKREFKRVGKNRRTKAPAWIILVLFASVAAFLPCAMVDATHHASSGLAVLGIIAAFAALLSAAALWSRLHAARNLTPLFLLPIDDSAIFRWKIQQALKAQTLSLLLLLGGLAGIGVALHFPPAKYLAILPIGLLAWLTQLALVLLCAARMPRRLYGFLIPAGTLTPIILFFTWSLAGPRVVMVIERCASSLNVLLPTDWPLSLFQFLLPGPHWIPAALLLPMGFLLCTVPNSMRLLRRDFGFHEFSQPPVSDLVPDMLPDTRPVNAASPTLQDGKTLHLGETAIADLILSREFLAPPLWPSRGRMEKWFWRCLDHREGALADLVFPGGVALSANWRSIFRAVLVAVAAGLLSGLVNEWVKYWIIGLGLLVAAILSLATVLGAGRAFQPVASSGVNIPIYAAFGVGFTELSVLLLKFSWVQLPPLLAFTMVVAGIGFHLAHQSVLLGIGLAFKLAFLMLAARFITLICRFSGCTNDTSSFRVRAVVIFCGAAISILLFLVVGIIGLAVTTWLGWLLCGLAALDAYALYRFYRWFYHRSCFDLMNLPPRL